MTAKTQYLHLQSLAAVKPRCAMPPRRSPAAQEHADSKCSSRVMLTRKEPDCGVGVSEDVTSFIV